ncbi:MAG: DUF503 domain-containing protein [Acidobacteria bacterium]|nr:DUF503 domain-containing protein [Acidobacteriota bacterium]
MPVLGAIHLEIRIDHAASLKDRRNVVRSLKARLRVRHNVSVAEIDDQQLMNRATVTAVTVSSSRQFAENVLRAVERDAGELLGGMLESASVEWVE